MSMLYLREVFFLLLASFACYRLAQAIVLDEGPWDLLTKLRTRLGVYDYDESGSAQTSLGKLFGCPYCIGFWIALLFALLVFPVSWVTILYWLGIAGIQAFLESIAPR